MDNPSATLNQAVREVWDTNAAFWDERMGEGNAFHLQLIEPAMLQLLEIRPGERVLEIACGNGQFARKLASMDARVTATDFSAGMIERARAHTQPFNETIDYRVLDATDRAALGALGEHSFDAVVSNMAIMDMSEIAPLFDAIPQILEPRGRLIFSTMHPCFNSNNPAFVAEMREENGDLNETFALKLTSYLESKTYQGLAMIGQPAVQYYFHRPLHELLGYGFRAGLVLDGLLEPRLPDTQSSQRWSSWLNYHEFPPVMVARFVVKR